MALFNQFSNNFRLWRTIDIDCLQLLYSVGLKYIRFVNLPERRKILLNLNRFDQLDYEQGKQQSLSNFQYHLYKLIQLKPIMKVIHIQKYGRTPIIAKSPLPLRNKGQHLIKMKYAPINPSDLNFYTGFYGIRKQNFPIMGFEGSGFIEESDDKQLIGRKVSVLANMSNGTYAEYMVSNTHEIIVWPSSVNLSDQQLSMFCINPLSVLGLYSIIEQRKANQIILSAAASNVNKTMVEYITKKCINKAVYGISRSNTLDAQLKRIGYQSLFRTDQFDNIKKTFKHNNAVFLDCVGGNFAGNIFNILPADSIMVNYGRLSKQNLGSIDLAELYFKNKQIRGFWLNTYLKSINQNEIHRIKEEVIKDCNIFKQKIRKIYPLEQFVEATRESIKNQSEGKILLKLF